MPRFSYPHAYLHRYVHYRGPAGSSSGAPSPPAEYNRTLDLEVARRGLGYILDWPIHWRDGTVTRNYPGQTAWNETGEQQFVWGDDAYMGLTLPSRMVVAGLDTSTHDYARFVATQHALFVKHLLDPTDGVFFHGADAKTGEHSCCKWGRANGWTMMTHVEVLSALAASNAPFAAAQLADAKQLFVAHATALAAFQNLSDGRWHQLLNDTTSYLETSCTSMFLVALIRGVEAAWLEADTFGPVISRAWRGLSSVIHPDGYVQDICDGFGIHQSPAQYKACPRLYAKSQPGLGSVLKAAVHMHRYTSSTQAR